MRSGKASTRRFHSGVIIAPQLAASVMSSVVRWHRPDRTNRAGLTMSVPGGKADLAAAAEDVWNCPIFQVAMLLPDYGWAYCVGGALLAFRTAIYHLLWSIYAVHTALAKTCDGR
jgi:hypothetical protein